MEWLKNRLLVIAIVAFLLAVLGGVGDGWLTRRLAGKYLSLAKAWRTYSEQREAWHQKEATLNTKADVARGKVAASRKFTPRPAAATCVDLARQFREAGYPGRMR